YNFEWNLPKGEPIEIDYSLVEKFQIELKPDEQNLISLRFYEKLSNAEIGEILNKKEGAVKVQMHRLLKKLRKRIEKEINNERS
nr:sigma-70 family RNA polymerase sigma factor [Candidatus Cloacimonadota bacterium]